MLRDTWGSFFCIVPDAQLLVTGHLGMENICSSPAAPCYETPGGVFFVTHAQLHVTGHLGEFYFQHYSHPLVPSYGTIWGSFFGTRSSMFRDTWGSFEHNLLGAHQGVSGAFLGTFLGRMRGFVSNTRLFHVVRDDLGE